MLSVEKAATGKETVNAPKQKIFKKRLKQGATERLHVFFCRYMNIEVCYHIATQNKNSSNKKFSASFIASERGNV